MGRYRLVTKVIVIPRNLEYPNYHSLYTYGPEIFGHGIHVKAPLSDDYYMEEFSGSSRLEMYLNNLHGEKLYFINKEIFLICYLVKVCKCINGDCIEIFLKPCAGTNLELVDRGVDSGIYINTETICPFCLSLMKKFDECAPVIETKIGQLIL